MTDHTLVNLAEVTDSAPEFGFGEIHEARFATRALSAEQLGLAYFRIRPGLSQPFAHRHGVQEEIYVVLSGAAVAHVDDRPVPMRALDALRIGPGAVRWFEAGPEGVELLVVGARAASGGANDAEMVERG